MFRRFVNRFAATRRGARAPRGMTPPLPFGSRSGRSPLNWCAILFLLILLPSSAHAHALIAEYRIVAEKHVQIEAWFETEDSAIGAKVQVFGPDDKLLAEGKTDAKGLFAFRVEEPQPLKVVIDVGQGHRKTISIPAERLTQVGYTSSKPATATKSTADPALPFADRGSRVSATDIVAGIGFLLALAAFVISLRNARQLRELKGRRSAPLSEDR